MNEVTNSDELREIRTFILLEEIGELIRQGEAELRAYRDQEAARAFIDAAEAQQWIDEHEDEEHRYNHNHDSKGRFARSDSGLTGGGGNGKIKSDGMYRKTENTGAFSHLPIRMSKKAVRDIAKKYDVDLTGITLNIDYNEELLRYNLAGEAVPERIGVITLFPNSFTDEENIVRTLVHEKTHVEQFRKYTSKYVQDNRKQFELEAEATENAYIEKLRRIGKL